MSRFECVVFLASLLAGGVVSLEVSPIDKVISLIEGMKKEVEKGGEAEASTYAKFACFCKDTTKAKSHNIQKGSDKIDVLSAEIVDKTQSKAEAGSELGERKAKQEQLSADLDSANARCAQEKAEYDAAEADVSKALSSLRKASKAMKDSKPEDESLLQVRDEIAQTLATAAAMNLETASKHKVLASLIQGKATVDPADPEYDYHSNDIIKLLANVEEDFKSQKEKLNEDFEKDKKACDELKASIKKQMTANSDAMKALEKNMAKLAKEIAEARQGLVEREDGMKEDELYLKDLTARCEARAQDWDQRSKMRSDEIAALSTALEILSGKTKGAADKVNARAFIQKQPSSPVVSKESKAPVIFKKTAPHAEEKPISFLQGSMQNNKVRGFLARSDLSQDARKRKAIAHITSEGQRLGSLVLISLAAQSAADPFKKVKGLLQSLVERLLEESEAEGTKKGFCDTEMAKATKERDYRFEDSQDLSAELEGLEAKRDALTEESKELTKQLDALQKALKQTTEDRTESKNENMATLKTAKAGLDSVRDALTTLKSFYTQAAKAALVQASPVGEDTEGAGFSGKYTGSQSGSKAVLGLLETIASDFDRTIHSTEHAEKSAQREFQDFAATTRASIGSKTTKKELDEQDLKTTKTSIKTKMEDLKSAQKLLDEALKEIEELKPTCIDSGMSYLERVAKREAEMEALKKALCILDENDTEPMCKGEE